MKFLLPFILLLNFLGGSACECPVTDLSRRSCEKYDVIFRGTVSQWKQCDDRPGSVTFSVMELFKGNVTPSFEVLFDCNECAHPFAPGEEWIIYTNYRQVNNGMLDWCSRSRKFFRNEREDFYVYSNGNSYEQELSFLRRELGTHRLLQPRKQELPGNRLPGTVTSIVLVLVSVAAVVLFYFLFNRFR